MILMFHFTILNQMLFPKMCFLTSCYRSVTNSTTTNLSVSRLFLFLWKANLSSFQFSVFLYLKSERFSQVVTFSFKHFIQNLSTFQTWILMRCFQGFTAHIRTFRSSHWKANAKLTFIFSVSASFANSSTSSIRPPTIFWNWPISAKDNTCLCILYDLLMLKGNGYWTTYSVLTVHKLFTLFL